MSNKPRRRSAKSRLSSSLSLISNSGQDREVRTRKEYSASPSDIPLYKWREIIDEAEEYFIVNSIREEIIRNAMEAIYARYLEESSYVFAVDCAYRAWLRFFDFMYLKHDPGENVQTIASRWAYDTPPDPVPQDSWACRRITMSTEETPSCSESDNFTAPCSTPIDIRPGISVPSFAWPPAVSEDSHKPSNTEGSSNEIEKEENDGVSKPDITSESPLSSFADTSSLASSDQRQRSIFTRTISMARANLPATTRRMQSLRFKNVQAKDKSDAFAEVVRPPEPLDLETLPPDRIYAKNNAQMTVEIGNLSIENENVVSPGVYTLLNQIQRKTNPAH